MKASKQLGVRLREASWISSFKEQSGNGASQEMQRALRLEVEEEDAQFVQSAINGRAPLLGIYSGVEIGPIHGEVKPMDWTGVLCLFTIKTNR